MLYSTHCLLSQKCAPPTQQMKAQIEGFDIGVDTLELYLENDESVTVEVSMMEDALFNADLDVNLESMNSSGPLQVDMELCGDKVLSLAVRVKKSIFPL